MKQNLKRVVALMSVLGLVSCPAFATAQTKHYKTTSDNNYKDSYKDESTANYKGEAIVPVNICPNINMYTLWMDSMSQNVGRAKPTVGCDKPIQLAGGINFDTAWGNLDHGYMGEVNDRFALNDAYINATGNVNDWIKAFIELSYNNIQDDPLKNASTLPNPLSIVPEPKPGLYSAGYSLETLDLQQGVIIIGDLQRFPLFLRLGKQFQDFGRYQIHPITRSMTQVMTETLQTSAELSFISGYNGMALHGSIFAFQNPMSKNNGHPGTNYGGQLGLGVISDQLGWDLGIGYIYDFTGVNDVAYAVTLFNSGDLDGEGSYTSRVGAATVYAMLNSGPFSLTAHYVSALQHFNSADLIDNEDDDDLFDDDDGDHAKPWAADITGAYGFNAFDKNQDVYLGYQKSGDAVNLYLPRTRWLVGYGIDILKNTNVGFEFSHDQDYSESDEGTGEGSYRGVLRVGVKFG